MTEKIGFIEELRRRNVFRVGLAYAITSWLIIQVLEIVLESFGSPEWVMKTVLVVLASGLPLALIFAWAFELTPEGIKREKDVDRSQSITPQTGRKLDFIIIGVLAVAVVLLLADRFIGSESPSTQGANETAAISAGKSIAVLPFVNMSSDPEQEYFSDGISEEILNALAKVKDLKVAGRTSSFAFKGENQDLRQVGETLGVDHILEGSVRKSGNKVRITAQLIQVEDGFHLWSESYDRELDDVFVIQDEISQAILEQLKAHLLEGEKEALAATRTTSEAFDLYLLAKQRIYERSRPTLEAAAGLLDEAIALDPEYSPAYAQRGIVAMLLSEKDYGAIPDDQASAQAKLYIDQALRLDPNEPEALAALGLYYLNQPGQSAQAIEALEKALAINPNLVNASNWLQNAYGQAGHPDKSFAILEQLIERDPLYRPAVGNIAGFYTGTGQIDKAQALIERIRPSMPNDPFLIRLEAQVMYANAEYAKGLMAAERALALRPDNYPNRGIVGQGLLSTGQYERLAVEGHPWQRVIALQVLNRLEEATLLAREEAASGRDVGSLIALWVTSGQEQEAIKFVEERWADLDAFERDYPLLGGGTGTLLDIAYAYSTTANEERFEDAMQRYRQGMDNARGMGFKNPFMDVMDARYELMSGNQDKALSLLDKAVNDGMVIAGPLAIAFPEFEQLQGDPEFEAIQARMIEHVNEERAELGLESMAI